MEWEAQQQPQQLPQVSLPTAFGGTEGGDGVGGSLYVKVMTDEQLEILRTQIAVYSAICEQLVDMHKAVTAQQDLAGVRLGNPYCDPFISSIGGHKISARQRWTPTPIQLQKLERIFDQGMGTPSKQKIKEITSELSQHGQISETNVYNWFQNRRARSKRKQQNNNNNGASSNNAEQQQEVEADIESPKDKKKTKSDENFYNNLCPGTSGEAHPSYLHSHQEMMMRSGIDGSNQQQSNNKMEPVFVGDEGNVKPACQTQSVGQQLSFMESMLETQRFDHLIGKMEEVPSSYSLYHSGEDYNMTG